ncbi:unnamed protein product [Phaeothamnion confervicola]
MSASSLARFVLDSSPGFGEGALVGHERGMALIELSHGEALDAVATTLLLAPSRSARAKEMTAWLDAAAFTALSEHGMDAQDSANSKTELLLSLEHLTALIGVVCNSAELHTLCSRGLPIILRGIGPRNPPHIRGAALGACAAFGSRLSSAGTAATASSAAAAAGGDGDDAERICRKLVVAALPRIVPAALDCLVPAVVAVPATSGNQNAGTAATLSRAAVAAGLAIASLETMAALLSALQSSLRPFLAKIEAAAAPLLASADADVREAAAATVALLPHCGDGGGGSWTAAVTRLALEAHGCASCSVTFFPVCRLSLGKFCLRGLLWTYLVLKRALLASRGVFVPAHNGCFNRGR